MNNNFSQEIKEKIQKMQERIKVDKNITNYSEDEMRYIQRPIGDAIYRGRPRKNDSEKAKPNDRIICEICGKEYFRSGSANHKATKYHQIHKDLNSKLVKLLLKK